MQVKELKSEGLKREFHVTLPAANIDKEYNEYLAQRAKTTKMDGFRPGKVPVSLVKKQHGKEIWVHVLKHAVGDATRKLLNERSLTPAVEPDIDLDFEKAKEGADLEYKISFEIYPDIPEQDFTALSFKQAKVELTAKEVEEGIERLLEANREFEPIKTARAAKKGDTVLMDYEGKIDGNVFEGGTAKDAQLELGSGQFIPGYEDQLIGAKKGETKDVKVTFPKEYHSKDHAGKDAVFTVTVHDILEPKMPKADDAFAKKAGFDSIAKFKEEIQKRMEAEYEQPLRMMVKKELFDKLDKLYSFDVPESMLKIEKESIEKAEAQHGEEEKKKKPTKKEQEELDKLALRRVRLGIVLSELARKNSIVVTEEEVRTAIYRHAASFRGYEQQVVEMYQKNPALSEQLRGPILEDKVVDHLLNQAKVTEEKITSEEFQKRQEAFSKEA